MSLPPLVQYLLAFLLLVAIVILVAGVSCAVLLIRMALAPVRRMQRRRAEQAARDETERRVLDAIMQRTLTEGHGR